ncbi:MAG TPA: nucleotide sugar dehydrogenase [Terriglobales bacterium]|nr:nucleotide sugar dehydrogenase [Terriglobales bacterium]
MAHSAVIRSTSSIESFVSKIETRQARIGIVGLGYVGLPLALLFAEQRFRITGFDVDRNKVDTLNSGSTYICRVPSSEIQLAIEQGFTATADYAAIRGMDVIIICVPTPLDEYRQPNLRFITDTAESLAPHLRSGQLVILESTTYPGTTEELVAPLLEAKNFFGLKIVREHGTEEGIFLAFSPEREDPGNNTVARRNIPKVIGGVSSQATDMAAAVYGTIFAQTIKVSSPAVAEMTKLLENIYRCVNIALVNELKLLCLRMGIDVWEVIDAAKTKPFGFQAFYPGPGLGGHCIPVDPYYLSWKAKEFDFNTRFIELAGDVNMTMPYHVVESVSAALDERRIALHGAKVMVLGIAYKKDIDDLRESPALTIVEELRKRGAVVAYNDPYFPFVGAGRKYRLDMASTPLQQLSEFDCVLIVTDHSDYDYSAIVAQSKLVVDTRNATRGIRSEKIVRC